MALRPSITDNCICAVSVYITATAIKHYVSPHHLLCSKCKRSSLRGTGASYIMQISFSISPRPCRCYRSCSQRTPCEHSLVSLLVLVRFIVAKWHCKGFSPCTTICPCQYHSANVLYSFLYTGSSFQKDR